MTFKHGLTAEIKNSKGYITTTLSSKISTAFQASLKTDEENF